MCVCVRERERERERERLHQALETELPVALRRLAAAGPRLRGQVSRAGAPPAPDRLCSPGQVSCLSVPEFPHLEAK